MKKTIKVVSVLDTAKSYEYVDENPIRGGVKDVYFSPDKEYVVAFYRSPLDDGQKERIKRIVSTYLQSIQNGNAPEYFLNEIFRWPYDIVERDKLTGIVVPVYHHKFYFAKGYIGSDNIQGQDKVGKWFTAPMFRNQQYPLRLDQSELGDWLSYFQIAVNISRGVKKLHQMGLAHSDLSYNNILVDPVTKSACIIDIDGLVFPKLFPP